MVSKNYTAFPRGSEWRKWDLHFHTPSSYDYKNKSVSNEEIINELAKNEVALVAITDHHVIDVERIRELQKLGRKQSVTVLPGIEFLCESRGHDPIHFIAIFPELEDFDLKYVWDQIQATTNLKKMRSERKAPNEVYCKIEETCKLIHELGGIVTIHAGSKTNTIDNITHALPHGVAQKKDIAECIDIFELGKIEDVDPYRNMVCKFLNRSIPLFIASDNHDINDYKLKVNCWVKSDPNFEGLMQVIYEPEERVKIQMEYPDAKAGYRVIERIERYRGGEPEPFQVKPLNPNLNCVIGGRSTGKSVFASTIAQRMTSELGIQNSQYIEFIEAESRKIKVFWEGDTDEIIREVEYYKQSFMYDVARDDERRNGLIRNILEQHEKSPLIEEYEQKVEEISKDIKGLLSELFSQKNKLAATRSQLLELGDKKGVEQEIEKLKSELKAISGGTLTDEESKNYEELQKSIQNEEQKIKALKNDIDALKLLRAERIVSHGLDSRVRGLFSSETSQTLQKALLEITRTAQDAWEKEVDSAVKAQESHVKNLEVVIRKYRESDLFKKAERVFSQTTQSQSLQNRIRSQEKTLGEINQHTIAIKNQQASVTQTREAIFKKHGAYATAATDYSAQIELQVDNLKIATEGHIKNVPLKESIEVAINQKSGKAQGLAQVADSDSFSSLASLVEKVLNAVVDEEVTIKQSFDRETALEHILAIPPFDLNFNLHYEGDSYLEMSDGKKAFVILKLLLEFSKRDCPIILDQPEDDLDNRSIYTDLVTYLKQKKVDRQIIAVTHNANIVVGADSELIIVANQNSDHTKNESGEKFEYITGSIEHSFPPQSDVDYILSKQGIREHVCEILEGGNEAFKNREQKYNL